MNRIRILLADDHHMLREGLRLLLEREPSFEVVAEASNGFEAVELAQKHAPDVAIVDIGMPLLNGIESIGRMKASCPETAAIVLSMHTDESYILRALNAGARGYLLKDSLKSDLIGAVNAVSQGHSYFSPKVSAMLQEDYFRQMRDKQKEDRLNLLTPREREILQLIAEGSSNKEIADYLKLSFYTVETHRAHILQKLNVHTVPELILYAVRKGIVH